MTTSVGQPHAAAIAWFFLFVAVTLGITLWAARRTRSTEHFYTAGRSVTGPQNGLALAGDYMSAASFLGIAGLVSLSGFDGLIYSIGFLVGWPVVMFLVAEPLRNLGRYTFADVVAYRLRQVPVRIAAAFGTLAAARGQYLVASIAFLVCGAALGFLPHNFPHARAFLGDAGSHLIGFLLAVLAILPHFYTPDAPQTLAVLKPLLVLAVTLADLVWVVALRTWTRRPFWIGDTNHFSHRLVRRGLSPTMAVSTIYLATLATALPAVLLPLHGWVVAMLIVSQCLAVVAIIAILESCNEP